MIGRFEDDINVIPLNIQAIQNNIVITSPYRLRCSILRSRCRLIILDESVRMLAALNNTPKSTDHTMIMIAGLQKLTIAEAESHVASLQSKIAQCDAKNAKRLEVEFRLVQASFYLILRALDVLSDLDVETSLSRAWQLCRYYPETAGKLTSSWTVMKTAISSGQHTANLLQSREIWWSWPKHAIGYLEHCQSGHPYSRKTMDGCPECGRAVEEEATTKPKRKAVDPQNYLKENDFVAAMRRQTLDDSK